MKLGLILIPLAVIATSVAGGFFTSPQINGWYAALNRPTIAPPNWVFGPVWTTIFILLAASLMLFVSRAPLGGGRTFVLSVFAVNLILNAGWSFIFFGQQLIGPAIVVAALLALSVAVLMVGIWPVSRAASLMLTPYLLWVSFATYLTYAFWSINR